MTTPDQADPKHTNRLINATSPYLLQHAHNPVDWYPWGEEAFEKARQEDKPIFLSIGYSACHWCHVMERESFEKENVAAILNDHFVSIKVDREERPDVDDIYMTAVQMLTGSGGWPMSVFLTPDLKPFYGGTYFPPEDRYGRPGFKSLLHQIASVWDEKRDEITDSSEQITNAIKQQISGDRGDSGSLDESLLSSATAELQQNYDAVHGGWGSAPKFPSAPTIRLLLREYDRTEKGKLLQMAVKTLNKMAEGGMYDQLGGGFARYSVDEEWLVPHFEKMLYDNAQLCVAYTEGWQLTGNAYYRQVAEEIISYIQRDMTDDNGSIYSAEDADSEGEEGKFYVWEYDEIIDALGNKDGTWFAELYNVKTGGNFSSHESYHKGKNILHLDIPITDKDTLNRLKPLKEKLIKVREKRVRPGLDDKILVSWNGLMITGLAKAGRVFDNDDYLKAGNDAADYILNSMRDDDGRLYHTARNGKVNDIQGYQEDYAFFINALIDLYEAGLDPSRLDQAEALTKQMIADFWNDDSGVFYATADYHTNLIARPSSSFDGATPSGNSVAALALQRLAIHRDNSGYDEKAVAILERNAALMRQSPRGFTQMLIAAGFHLQSPKEIVISGEPDDSATEALMDAVRNTFVPYLVLAQADGDVPASSDNALLAGKTLVDGQPAAYVCRNFACQAPTTDPAALKAQLED